MTNNNLRIICECIAEQAYTQNLLAEKMIDASILQRGELQKMRETMPETKLEFCLDFLEQLKTRGLSDEES
jgi:hypothetical protein